MNWIIERVFAYCDAIVSGKIKNCKKHKWAVKRFLKDYEDCQKDDSLFYFDEEIVEDFYWFAREFKHVEGILAGEPVELTDFQLFLSANIFGFKKKSNGARRFRKVFIQLARKNAKSQFLAIVAAFVTFLGDEKQRAYIAGWTRDQSSEVYEAIKTGISSSELLEGKWKEAYSTIEIFKNSSVIVPLSKEARKTGDGKNPSVGIVDEYHAHETDEIYDVLSSGMVARKEPLMFIITTAGFDLSRPCYREYEYVSDILDPSKDVENDDYFVMICELEKDDDIKDESNWIKANPIVATYEEGIAAIRSDLKVALDRPEKMRAFLTKNMNIWVDKKDNGYMDMSKWRQCEVDNIDFVGATLWIGGDLSMTTDLTSVGWVGMDEEGDFIVGQHSFMPEARLKEKMATDKVRYDLWAEQGYLTLTPGEMVDYTIVESWIENFASDKDIQEFDYDKWNALHLAQNLENKGFTCVEIPQRIANLSIPTKTFREKVYEKKVKHTGDPVLFWALNNAVIKMDDQENIMISKKISKNRIDPAAAVLNAFARAMYGASVKVDVSEFANKDFLNKLWN
ncbi:terminase large subunit [Bacillus cytotoxicus]|uniref:Phage Terminase n=2 Tax=Bacillus cereus group TaxID=86661 RepID=A0AAX2CJH6_9BACI|nr:terminase TerL endonuclease subunit [Bacillus cytotoxicus]AWC29487.1 terminase large subunit [Bacillus cytotoxicus]AWC41618.1 terminase large subunit [Bacillus cytotoxicus]AWC45462.1 terminase large subunit [Bacillus cytotoxicus]AWC49549.1 terminase large subunit [Bacillus cytotoxicus]AWC53562.1 terminase large subunit [Bacillus cytotoxicus]